MTTRDKFINLRISSDEKDYLEMIASARNMSLSTFARSRLLGMPTPSAVDREALAELRRQGGLLKLLAAQGAVAREDFERAFQQWEGALSRLVQAMEIPDGPDMS